MKTATQRLEAATRALDLQALTLHSCEVGHGEAEHLVPGSVDIEHTLTFERSDTDDTNRVIFLIETRSLFKNSDDQVIADIAASFTAIYSLDDTASIADTDIESYGERMVLFQTYPFIREFLASMTNRLGVPTFFLPVLRSQDLA